MDVKKLFHVLVMGGAILGAVSSCGGDKSTSSGPQSNPAGSTGSPDGGTDGGGGGGPRGW